MYKNINKKFKRQKMVFRNLYRLVTIVLIVTIIWFNGCERDVNTLGPATYPSFGEVFLDVFVSGLDFSAFATSKLDAFEIDEEVTYDGSAASIKITVPGVGDPTGGTLGYAGGALYSKFARDLSGYNALTFWGKSSTVATVSLIGFGNDNITTPLYSVQQNDIVFGTSWKKYIIPIPLASKLTTETGMFHFAAGADSNGYGYVLWFDEIQFENLKTIKYPFITVNNTTIESFQGQTIDISSNVEVGFDVNGTIQNVSAMSNYYSFISSNDTIVSVSEDNIVTAIGKGTATITVKLDTLVADDKITVNVGPAPTTGATAPTFAPSDVISLFSNTYNDVTVDTWNPYWLYSTAEVADIQIAGNDIKQYSDLNFVGIEFTSQTIDASSMTNFHMDIWAPEVSTGANFVIEIIDFGADNAYGGTGNDADQSYSYTMNTSSLTAETWINIDIALTGLPSRTNVAQIVLSSGTSGINTVYIDNVLFHK